MEHRTYLYLSEVRLSLQPPKDRTSKTSRLYTHAEYHRDLPEKRLFALLSSYPIPDEYVPAPTSYYAMKK